jgi:hypothetical protein
MPAISSAILWSGRSAIDGSPIALIATGLERPSLNKKTGPMVQTFIIRTDMSPIAAINTGADVAICGDCRHRGTIEMLPNGETRNVDRPCYVDVAKSVTAVYGAIAGYVRLTVAEGRAILAGRLVRLGAYGDPAAVPFHIWDELLQDRKACTGYTHQWRAFPQFRAYCMASCDNAADFTEAKASGWRTFRVRSADEALAPREVVCPASDEAGAKTTCNACKACGGLSSKARADIAIVVHGAAGKVRAFEAAKN